MLSRSNRICNGGNDDCAHFVLVPGAHGLGVHGAPGQELDRGEDGGTHPGHVGDLHRLPGDQPVPLGHGLAREEGDAAPVHGGDLRPVDGLHLSAVPLGRTHGRVEPR